MRFLVFGMSNFTPPSKLPSVSSEASQPFANAISYCFASTHSSRKDLSKGQHHTFFSSRREPADDTVQMWREQVASVLLVVCIAT